MARDLPRLFVEDNLRRGGEVATSDKQTHYLLNVLRLKSADNVLLFNGRDGEWEATITRADRKRTALLRVDSRTRLQPPPLADIEYWFAPLKQARLDYMIQKSVEMGAAVLRPVLTERTQNRRVGLDRMKANAIEAAEQCGLLCLPRIFAPESLTEALGNLDPNRTLIFFDETADSNNNPIEILNRIEGCSFAVLVGPEGGFSDNEKSVLRESNNVRIVRLGSRILRADTAAVAALTLVQAVLGDWQQ